MISGSRKMENVKNIYWYLMAEGEFNPDRPTCRRGIVARDLVNGMVYIRHRGFSSRIINRQSWNFLQLCDGRDFEQLSQAVAKLLGFRLTPEQLGSSIQEFADRGVFEALLHELGHATVANFYGGEVPEIVINSKGHFAVVTNMTVLKGRRALAWYLSMGTVVDVFVWLALLAAFHYRNNYLLLMFLLPQTIYFLIFSYSIFKNSDYLKFVCALLDQPVPAHPWKFLPDSWSSPPKESAKGKLLGVMTLSLGIKLLVTVFLIWTFLKKEPRVLALYVIYRFMVYTIGHWSIWWRRWTNNGSAKDPG